MLPTTGSTRTAAIWLPRDRRRARDTVDIVEFGDDRELRERRRHARAVGHPERQRTGSCTHQQRVDVPVIAAGELHDRVATGCRACQPQGRHRRLGSGANQPYLLDRRHDAGHELGELHLELGRRAEAQPASDPFGDGLHDGGVRVTQDHRPPGPDEVEVRPPVRIDDRRSPGALDEDRVAADGSPRANRTVDAARDARARAGEDLLRRRPHDGRGARVT